LKYTAALIGCGKIGSDFADDPKMKGDIFAHAEAYHVCPDTDLIAIADTGRAALDRAGARWNVDARFTSATDLLAAVRPDIVSVATPTSSHYPVLMELIESGNRPRAILCEKPVASTVEQAENAVAAAKRRDVLLVVMHMRRYAGNMKRLRELIRSGGIGDVRGVSGWCIKGAVHNGVHWFDLLRYLLGVEVEMVSALDVLHEGGDDPTLDVAMLLDNGMLATMRGAEHLNFTICEMDIMGSRGRAQVVDSSYRVDISTAVPSPRYTGYVELVDSPVDMGDRKNVMLHAVEDIVHCLDTGDAPRSTGEDGVEALRIALAAGESARRNGMMIPVRRGA
jgi:predicted dehydrogenase